jgi:hypothetical protein
VFSRCECLVGASVQWGASLQWVPIFSGSHSLVGASLYWVPVFSGP